MLKLSVGTFNDYAVTFIYPRVNARYTIAIRKYLRMYFQGLYRQSIIHTC